MEKTSNYASFMHIIMKQKQGSIYWKKFQNTIMTDLVYFYNIKE